MRKATFRMYHKESGNYWATCGLTKFSSRAFTFDSKADAEAEIIWNIQHNKEFPAGSWEILESS